MFFVGHVLGQFDCTRPRNYCQFERESVDDGRSTVVPTSSRNVTHQKRSETVVTVDVSACWEWGRTLGMGTGSETVVTAGATARWALRPGSWGVMLAYRVSCVDKGTRLEMAHYFAGAGVRDDATRRVREGALWADTFPKDDHVETAAGCPNPDVTVGHRGGWWH